MGVQAGRVALSAIWHKLNKLGTLKTISISLTQCIFSYLLFHPKLNSGILEPKLTIGKLRPANMCGGDCLEAVGIVSSWQKLLLVYNALWGSGNGKL